MRMHKKTHDIELICQRCGAQSANLKEYVLHKKDIHHVRVKDSIDSLRTVGIDDPIFEKLLEEHAKEKLHPEYAKEARKAMEAYMRDHNR